MFLGALSKSCSELDFREASQDFVGALASVRDAAEHTNIMMWIGRMKNCPIDLPSQGQLLKHGRVRILKGGATGGEKARWRWSLALAGSGGSSGGSGYLILFHQTLVLCLLTENKSHSGQDPGLAYRNHVSINKLRIRDVTVEGEEARSHSSMKY